jgi:hypothetical protein
VEGTYGHRTERLIYGVFTTTENSIYGSAVCAFRLQDVMDSFEGAFKVFKKKEKTRRKTEENTASFHGLVLATVLFVHSFIH